MNFVSIRVREDNLMYLFYNDNNAFSVDSYEPEILLHALCCDFNKTVYSSNEIERLKQTHPRRNLRFALTTHSHFDHAGGNDKLGKLSPSTVFYQHDNLSHNQEISLDGTTIESLFTPCHTRCSVCFLIRTNKTYLLTGDFIFKLGCGRFFEGNSSDFISSLKTIIDACDGSTILLYGHDYYEVNRRFASQFLSLPTPDEYFLSLAEEMKYNPFINHRAVSLPGSDSEKIAQLRKMKDDFK